MTEFARRNVFRERFMYAAVGLVVGAAVTYGAIMLFMASPDEFDEQPPIIVKGGSLLFESSEPWLAQPGDIWLRFMPNGLVPGSYELTFDPATCQARTVPWFKVFYDPDDEGTGGEESFEVTLLPRPGPKASNGPAVKGAGLLNTSANTLRRDGTSQRIIRVEGPGAQVLCTEPTQITAKPKK